MSHELAQLQTKIIELEKAAREAASLARIKWGNLDPDVDKALSSIESLVNSPDRDFATLTSGIMPLQWQSVKALGLPKEDTHMVVMLKSGVEAFGINKEGTFCQYDIEQDSFIEFCEFGGTGVTGYMYSSPESSQLDELLDIEPCDSAQLTNHRMKP